MSAQREFTLNQYFSTLYNWRGKKSQCKSIAIRIIEEGLLELRHSEFVGKNMPHDMVVVERITLHEKKGVTTVTKDVFMKNHRLPFFVVPVFWFVNRFGWSPEPDQLKLLCERDSFAVVSDLGDVAGVSAETNGIKLRSQLQGRKGRSK